MKKTEIKLIATDIDGTLIDDDGVMPANFIEVMAELERLNIPFVAASGRGIPSIKHKINYDSKNIYRIADNGSFLEHQDKIFFENSFSREEANDIITTFRKCKEVSIMASTADNSFAELNKDHDEAFLKEFNVAYEIVDDITKIDKDFVKITMRSDHHTSENFDMPELDKFKEKHHLVRAGIPWIDCMKKDSNKGNALEVLLDHLEIDKKHTIGFGDFPNDIHMLEVTNKSFAMAEADESVKNMADEIIGSNNDNSVMKKIIQLLELDI